MAVTENQPANTTKSSTPPTLLDKFGTPLFWIAVGYGLGFFHGNTSGKKKASKDQ